VELYIQDLGGENAPLGYYKGNGDWQAGATPVALSTENAAGFAVYQSSWEYIPSPAIGFRSGNRYLVVSKARDRARNWQDTFLVGTSSNSFIFDTRAPESFLTRPNAAQMKTLADISGTSTDALEANYAGIGANIARIKITVRDLTSPNTYWKGAAWGVDASTLNPSGIAAVAGPAVEWYRSGVSWISDRQYRVSYWAEDDLGNAGSLQSYDVVYDSTPPRSAVTYPSAGAKFNTLPTISGTANAQLSGLSSVSVRVSSWAGTGWSAVTGWTTANVAILQSSWTYTGLSSLVSGTTYQVEGRAADNAGNTDVILSTVTFVYDIDPPQTALTRPEAGNFYGPANPLATLSGTAQDAFGVDRVLVRVSRSGDGYSWDGAGWVNNSSTWNITAGNLSWTYSGFSLHDGYIYTINSRAQDLAGTLSGWTTATFTYDGNYPVAALQKPDSSYHRVLPTLSGTAQDPQGTAGTNRSGLLRVEAAVQIDPDGSGNWWNPGTHNFDITDANSAWFDATGNLAGASGPLTWSVPDASTPTWTSNQKYRVRVRALDRSLNVSTNTVIERSFIYDTDPPLVKITQPAAASYNSLAAISGTAADNNTLGAVNAVQIRIYNYTVTQYWDNAAGAFTQPNANLAWFVPANDSGDWAVWVQTFTWSSGNKYQIEARSQDRAANYSTVWATATFRYDSQEPNSFVSQPADQTFVRSLSVITGTAHDVPTYVAGDGYGGTGLSQVQAAIRDNADQDGSPWWGGASFNQSGPQPFSYGGDVSGAQVTWDYSGLTGTNLFSGTSYYITARSLDNAVNQEQFMLRGATFTFDNTPAVSTITLPSAAAYNALSTIFGTAADYPYTAGGRAAGVREVRVTVYRVSDDSFWTGSGDIWTAGTTNYIPVTGTTDWQLTTLPPWQSGQKYRIQSIAWDNALPAPGNAETTLCTRYFVFDSSAPTSWLISPVSGGKYSQLDTITGTAGDFPLSPSYSAGLKSADVRIVRVSDGWEWTGSSFTNVGTWWRPAQLSGSNWQYASVPAWNSGNDYTVMVRATDNLDNTQSPATSRTFTYDNTRPESSVILPVEGTGYSTANPLRTISGTAYDATAGVDRVELSLRLDNPPLDPVNAGAEDRWWSQSGSSWAAGSETTYTYEAYIYNSVGQTREWYYNGISSTSYLSGKTYRLKTRAYDLVTYPSANYETPASTRNFSVDNAPPSSEVSYPLNGQFYTSLLTISGTAQDDSPTSSGVKQTELQIYNSDYGYWNGSGWQGSTWTLTVNLTPSNTIWQYTAVPPWTSGKAYSFKSRTVDFANNTEDASVKSWITVSIDTAPPGAFIVLPQHNKAYSSLNTITGTSVDDFSGIKDNGIKVIVKDLFTGETWNGSTFAPGDNWRQASGTNTWKLTESVSYASGKKYLVYVSAEDNAGNATSLYQVNVNSNTFIFDNEPPQTTVLFPASGNPTHNAMATISGTSADLTTQPNGFVSDVKEMHVRVSYLLSGDTYYWTGGAPYAQYWSSYTYPSNGVLASGTTQWSYTHPEFANANAWTNGRNYGVEVWAVDNAGKTENPAATRTFTFDNDLPQAAVTYPLTGKAYRNLARITGTAGDTYSAITKVEICLRDTTSGTTYYDGTTWINNPSQDVWFDIGSAGSNWNYVVAYPTSVWTDAHSYTVKARVTDAGNNLSNASVSIAFKNDTSEPSSTIAYPQPGFYRQVTTISGTATDPNGAQGAGVEGMEVSIYRVANGDYWKENTKSWVTADQQWNAAAYPSPTPPDWSIAISTDPWEHGQTYLIKTRAKDKVINVSQYENGGNGNAGVSVTIDRRDGDAAFVVPQNINYSSLPSISGTAQDTGAAGVKEVRFGIKLVNANKYWRETPSSGFDSSSLVWISTPVTAGSWRYTRVQDDNKWSSGGNYEAYARVLDNAGNLSGWTTSTFSFDNTAPSSSLLAPDTLDYRNTYLTQITGTADDGT
ncbi:MAG: RHS repeat domain-containing protein, partial [Endomicrobiales bacterium]